MKYFFHYLRHGNGVGNLTSAILLIASGCVLCMWLMIQVVEMGDPPNSKNDQLETALLIWIISLGASAIVPQSLSLLQPNATRRRAHIIGAGLVITILALMAILIFFMSDESDARYEEQPNKSEMATPRKPSD